MNELIGGSSGYVRVEARPRPPTRGFGWPARRRTGGAGTDGPLEPGQRGQSLVEFALILAPLFLLLLGIIQFGFIFNTYVTLTNATREAARDGSIYVYDRSAGQTKATNDLARNEQIRTSLLASMNLLGKSAPQFTTGSTWTNSGLTYTNGDLTITYSIPTGITDSDPRKGQRITVQARYHQDLIIPMIANIVPRDAGDRLVLTGEVTMVIN